MERRVRVDTFEDSFLAKFHGHGRNKEDSFVLCVLLRTCFRIEAYGFRVANSEAETSSVESRRDG